MAKAREGDRVKVHYTGRLEGGEVFDSSVCLDDECGCQAEPLEFTIGEGEVIPGFEKAVVGMSEGETKTFTIPVDEAYGKRNEELVVAVERTNLPEEVKPEVGARLEVTQEDGEEFPVVITAVSDTHVTLDANHPLAGRDLTFEIELVEIG
ncbi:MAG TPA: peptidylprolyl isomerase [Geobacteraceae bacterium]|nr:peptidylprolyl isomerase [Geobacteraceae bacterium]